MFSRELFASRLKELRLTRGDTQVSLGAAVGLAKQAINDIEHFRRTTTIEKICEIADYFDVSIDYLVGRTDNPGRLH